MPAAIGVVAAENLQNAQTVRVTISGTPNGNLEIWGCEVADGPEFGCPYTILSPTQFEVSLPGSGMWYLWAKDADGFGAQFEAVYLTADDHDDTDAIGSWLQETLLANKRGMEAMIRTWYPETTIKQIHYGVAASITDFPSIAITAPHFSFDWAAMAWGQEWHWQFTIACDAQKSEEENEVPLATRMVEAVMHVLNRKRYNSPVIGGRHFWDCAAKEGNADEMNIADVGWVAIGSVVWTGKQTKQVIPSSFADDA